MVVVEPGQMVDAVVEDIGEVCVGIVRPRGILFSSTGVSGCSGDQYTAGIGCRVRAAHVGQNHAFRWIEAPRRRVQKCDAVERGSEEPDEFRSVDVGVMVVARTLNMSAEQGECTVR